MRITPNHRISRIIISILGRVVGGTDVNSAAKYPYYAALITGSLEYAGLQCGGTILDAWHILTAAHCNIRPITYVRVGTVKRSIYTVWFSIRFKNFTIY